MTGIRPQRLKNGDEILLISPSSRVSEHCLRQSQARLQAFGLKPVLPEVTGSGDGYYACTGEEAVAQLHQGFADRRFKAVMAVRGGVGAWRLLPHLDYELIRANPKVLLGYSDITALLTAISSRTGLVTFHGPVANSPFTEYTRTELAKLTFSSKVITLASPAVSSPNNEDLISTLKSPETLVPGEVTGHLWGGNLSVFVTLLGTPYLPTNWENTILFFEDVAEDVYRIDRMLGQLVLANILPKVKGVVFGGFSGVSTKLKSSFTLNEVLARHLSAYNIPGYMNATFGHQGDMLTLPIGAEVKLDANACVIELIEPAVL